MKKLGYLFLSMFLLTAASCGSRSAGSESGDDSAVTGAIPDEMTMEDAMHIIELANSECPVNLGMGNNVVMESVSFDNNTLTYRYSVARILRDRKDNPEVKKLVVQTIKTEAEMMPANKLFMRAIAKSGADIQYIYHAEDGDSTTMTISNKELHELLK